MAIIRIGSASPPMPRAPLQRILHSADHGRVHLDRRGRIVLFVTAAHYLAVRLGL
jgi:hypothetical protein